MFSMTTQTINIDMPTIPLETVISRNVKVALALRDKNQTDLSRALGVSRATVSQKIHGVCAWTIADIEKAGQYLSIEPAKFLDPHGLLNEEWGRWGLNPGPAGSGSKPLRGIMQRFTLAA